MPASLWRDADNPAELLSSDDMSTGLDRRDPRPLYYQLEQILRDTLREKKPGERLPGDHQLCEMYDVSRTVVRQALSGLETAGEIERIKGRGTFVAQPKVPEGLAASLTGLFEDVAARGATLSSEVVFLGVVAADEKIAELLARPVGTPVVRLERVRSVDSEPWVWTVTHLPADRVPDLESIDFTHVSLYAVLNERYGITLATGHRSIEAAVATAQLSKSLGVKRGDPMLVLRSVTADSEGAPIETFVAYHRGDRSRFEVRLVREADVSPTSAMLAAPAR